MENLAPICIFVYNRPLHTVQTIESLKKNDLADKSIVYIFSDGALNESAKIDVLKVRSYINQIQGFKQINIILRDKNWGLSQNIISGVTEIVNKHGKIIVLEDDMITSPFFLSYMNSSIDKYKNEKNVASIHGYVYPIDKLPEMYFLKGADCWGWGTWSESWKDFESDGKKLLKEVLDRNLTKEIDFNGKAGYVRMLRNQIKGRNDSWAIRWHISNYLKGKLTLYPGESYVNNIGCDNSGVHSVGTTMFSTKMCERSIEISDISIVENIDARKLFETYYNQNKKSLILKIKDLSKKRISGFKFKSSFFKIKNVLVKFLPLFMINWLSGLFGNRWTGNYKTWEEAQSKSVGYDSELILDTVFESVLKVKYGFEIYERDSVILDHVEYSWPLLAALLLACAESNNKIHVLDFGGSLGSTYFQNKKILDKFSNVSWSIVEQKHFIEKGRKFIQDDRIKFYESVNECLKNESPNIILFSSVLQYLSEPFKLVDELLNNSNADYVIIDRTPFTEDSKDKITIQRVDPKIYKASYPCWNFNLDNLKQFFANKKFNVMEEFDAIDGKRADIQFKGLILKKSDNQ